MNKLQTTINKYIEYGLPIEFYGFTDEQYKELALRMESTVERQWGGALTRDGDLILRLTMGAFPPGKEALITKEGYIYDGLLLIQDIFTTRELKLINLDRCYEIVFISNGEILDEEEFFKKRRAET